MKATLNKRQAHSSPRLHLATLRSGRSEEGHGRRAGEPSRVLLFFACLVLSLPFLVAFKVVSCVSPDARQGAQSARSALNE